MFIGIGTVINVVAVVAGGVIGVLVGRWFSESLRHLITDALGLVTMIGAVSAAAKITDAAFVDAVPSGAPTLIVLGAILIGGGVGHLLRIEERLDGAGELLRRRFAGSGDSTFVEGFVTASLIFVIGPLAILGSISDGLGTGIDQLALKSSLDFFAAIAFAASFGIGVAFSAIPVGMYQAAWTVVGVALGSILSDAQIAAMTATGGLLLGAIALRLLNIKQVQTGTLLPALFVAPLLLALF